jgi:hypothetical protein
MKKLIPFDIDRARAGAKVVTEKGDEVTIVNFNSNTIPGWPIIGRYTSYLLDDVYELWPASGRFDEIDTIGRDVPPALMIEEEETPKGYTVIGQSIAKDGKPLFAVFLNSPTDLNVDDLLKRIAGALNFTEGRLDRDVSLISEVEYEKDPAVVRMSREDWVKIRERTELLEEQNKLLGEESHKKSLELESAINNTRVLENRARVKQRQIEELEAWKQKAIESRKRFYKAVKLWESIRPE